MKMMTSGVAFGLKRVGSSFNKPFSFIRLLFRNTNTFALIRRWPRQKFTHLGPFDLSVSLGRCFATEITATSANSQKDLLLQRLVLAQSAPDVMDLVGAHHSIMNSKHLMQALETLFKLRKLDGFSTEITTTPEFVSLCQRLRSQIRGIHISDAVNALKIVTHFGLDSSNVLVKALLDIIRHNVNYLSLHQIVYLQFCLTKIQGCQMVDALKIALPLVFEVQLDTKLDRTNLHHVLDMLLYASRNKVSTKSLNTLIQSLTNLINSGEALDMRAAKHIALALTSKLIALRVPVAVPLQKSLTTLTQKIEEYDLRDIDMITSRLVRLINKKHEEFYNEDFLDRSASLVVKKDCGVQEGSWILRSLTQVSHINISLLDYLAKKIVAEPSALTECKPFTLLTLVSGFSEADYKPADWPIIRDLIVNHRLLAEGQIELPWLKFGLELAALGCFSSTLLERIFSEDFLRKFLARENNYLDTMRVLRLHQAVSALFPSYGGPSPPQDILDQAVALNRQSYEKHAAPLEAALARGLGGSAYLMSKLFTRSHVFVDHVIIMRQGGFPIALSPPVKPEGSTVYVEDLEVPVKSKVVVISSLKPRCYTYNSSRMRGNTSLQIRILEALNFAVIPVSLQLWYQIPENERIPYLMQSIKHKCETSADVSAIV